MVSEVLFPPPRDEMIPARAENVAVSVLPMLAVAPPRLPRSVHFAVGPVPSHETELLPSV